MIFRTRLLNWLLARTNAAANGMPGWIWAKMVIWLCLAVGGPLAAKRLTTYRLQAFYGFVGIAVIAVAIVVFR